MEGGAFVLGLGLDLAEHLAGRRLINTGIRGVRANRLQETQGPEPVDFTREGWLREGGTHERLRRQIIHFVRLAQLNRVVQGRLIHHVPIRQIETIQNTG